MRKFHFFCVAAILLLTSTVYADLAVHEYVPGEKVVLDSETGNYWYYDLTDFVDQTYSEQISSIAALGTYGNIAGGWHMATYEEMEKLWGNTPSDITDNFAPTFIYPGFLQHSIGRYDEVPSGYPGYHYYA